MNQGPLDTLITAIDNVIGDLEGKLERAHADYEVTKSDHEKEVRRLEELIR